MLNRNGVLFDHINNRIVPRLRADDTEERGWNFWQDQQELPGERGELIRASYIDAVKDILKEEAKHQQKFNKLVNQASRVLFKVKTFSPLDVFPTTLIIDPEKITIQMRNFFSSGEIRSIHIKNVSHIYVDMGPFFATLKIVDQSILDNEVGKIEVTYLKKEDAKRARRIIQGLIVAHKAEIDVMKLNDDNLLKKLEELGRMQ